VNQIINSVRTEGDAAVKRFTRDFDGCELTDFEVSQEELDNAIKSVDEDFIQALTSAASNIEEYHTKQLHVSWFMPAKTGGMLGQKVLPFKRIGAYVPGGTAAYPSSVLMTVIPAKVAGVCEIYVVSPPGKDGRLNPYTLAAARIAGASRVFKVGGAQAIAALAYGTETIPAVYKIVGPGNIYVTAAKKLVSGDVGIDMLAGPSEIVVVAEDGMNPSFIAADLISQAEHDPMAASILVTPSLELAEKVNRQIQLQLENLPRRSIAESAFKNSSAIIITEDLTEAVELANRIAPEHLELMVSEPLDYIDLVKDCGALFIGQYSPEPLGDYFAGTNHVLPTGGSARFSSALSVETFLKKISVVWYSKEGILEASDKIIALAEAEGLEGHANAIEVRMNLTNERET
jgi:histidinol dehydrogenase